MNYNRLWDHGGVIAGAMVGGPWGGHGAAMWDHGGVMVGGP